MPNDAVKLRCAAYHLLHDHLLIAYFMQKLTRHSLTLLLISFIATSLTACSWLGLGKKPAVVQSVKLTNAERKREVPLAIYLPNNAKVCTKISLCRVVIFNHGYGVKHTEYSYLAQAFAEQGVLVVSVQHDLPGDPPLEMQGDLVKLRTPAWQRGAETILFVRESLKATYEGYDWKRMMVVGHSNGGDIAAWLANSLPQEVGALITLDHRRVPIARRALPRVLTLRSTDMQPDEGVLPTEAEQQSLNIAVAQLTDAKHNDMADDGPASVKAQVVSYVQRFVDNISLR
jgi:pimeloyl-ACP methyl ester carboxylesterase